MSRTLRLEEIVNNIDGKIRTFRIKEARLPALGTVLLLCETRDRVLACRSVDAVAGGGKSKSRSSQRTMNWTIED